MNKMVGKVIREGRLSSVVAEAPDISSFSAELIKKYFLEEVAFELSLE